MFNKKIAEKITYQGKKLNQDTNKIFADYYRREISAMRKNKIKNIFYEK